MYVFMEEINKISLSSDDDDDDDDDDDKRI